MLAVSTTIISTNEFTRAQNNTTPYGNHDVQTSYIWADCGTVQVCFTPFSFICNTHLQHILPFVSTWADNCVCCQCLICRNSSSIVSHPLYNDSYQFMRSGTWIETTHPPSPVQLCVKTNILLLFVAEAVKCVKQGSYDFVLVLSLCLTYVYLPKHLPVSCHILMYYWYNYTCKNSSELFLTSGNIFPMTMNHTLLSFPRSFKGARCLLLKAPMIVFTFLTKSFECILVNICRPQILIVLYPALFAGLLLLCHWYILH